jgi:hypothetical protein
MQIKWGFLLIEALFYQDDISRRMKMIYNFENFGNLKGYKMNRKNIALTAMALATLSLSGALSVNQAFAEDAPQPPPAGEQGQDAPPPPKDGPNDGADAGKGGPRAGEFEKRGREMFEKTDTDKDGFLSKAEMEASQKDRMEEMFDKTDTDKDGKLSPEELKKGREAMREKFRSKYKEHREGEAPNGAEPKPEAAPKE